MDKWNIDQMYEPIQGRALNIVPKALENGGTFIRMSQAMSMRSQVLKLNDEDVIKAWVAKGFWTLDPIFYAKNGDVKFGDINNPKVMEYVKQITPALSGNLYCRRMMLPIDFKLSDISGDEFTRKDIEKYGNKLQLEQDAKKNILLESLSNHNPALLEEYIEEIYKFAKDNYNKTKLMGIWFSDKFKENNMGLVRLFGINDYHNSSADGDTILDDYGLLIKMNEQKTPTYDLQRTNAGSSSLQQILDIENNDNLSKNDRIKSIQELYLKK